MSTTCSRCSNPAVGACTKCGKFYCSEHGGNRQFWDGSGRGCCEECFDQWSANYAFGLVFAVIVVIVIAVVALSKL
jgi:hypothetical protein